MEADQAAPLAPPRGIYPARVDDKGRLKLPVPFQRYLGSLPEKELFATSLDRRTAQLYIVSQWVETENRLRGARGEDAVRAKRVRFTAQELGADAEMDAQGRVLLPPELRRELGIENQSVRVVADGGRIDILPEAVFEQLKRQAVAHAEDDVEALGMSGLV